MGTEFHFWPAGVIAAVAVDADIEHPFHHGDAPILP